MLRALERTEFRQAAGSSLARLCSAGVDYAWMELERFAGPQVLRVTSAKARTSLRRYLQGRLEWLSRASYELEWTSFVSAMNSLGLAPGLDRRSIERMFLRDRPAHRLFSLFKQFPVLAQLWSLAISQWRKHVEKILRCATKDAQAISRRFLNQHPIHRIKNMRLGLSDPHDGGRTVSLIEFNNGRVVYKPRSGKSEAAWHDLLVFLNRNGFRPKLRAARVLQRKSYSWMEYVEAGSCKNQAAVRRFYERLGGTIAAVYLLKAVDCHRENVIAAGEYPVLVDVDALWHVSPVTKTQDPATVLYRTGFLPNSRRGSLQSRSSVLGWTKTGKHLARMNDRPVRASDYSKEIIQGFSRAWECLMGTPRGRSFFLRKLRQIRIQRRRWIYLATEKYAAILRSSITPAALQSEEARKAILTKLCSCHSAKRSLVQAEIEALMKLDLPYFVRKTAQSMPGDRRTAPSELTDAIRNGLLATNRPSERGR